MSNFSSESLTEKPLHKRYLRDFRVERCPCFADHRCQQHRPYTCFYWHFPNQRRRRLSLSPQGAFSYSPDVYCAQYDEIRGVCPNGDQCPLLHRTVGDSERRYHSRYLQDHPGHCSRNGPHCAFAHGLSDLRKPVYGVVERPQLDAPWNDREFVLAHYKAWPCTRPGCRLGSSCPYYHGPRDKRRSPTDHKYVAAACPRLDAGCPDGERCGFAHSGAELRFHPDVYKTTRCRDLEHTGSCPRGALCSFAHADDEKACSKPFDRAPGAGRPSELLVRSVIARVLSSCCALSSVWESDDLSCRTRREEDAELRRQTWPFYHTQLVKIRSEGALAVALTASSVEGSRMSVEPGATPDDYAVAAARSMETMCREICSVGEARI
ncbi:hypothetical protein HPB48_007447 [Haemaphysalis longicornis]|uniref:C3H1-type domain-containing protein n=1 Tax=Haemaphysalis longicornis TaxID=44386 RepID=A0A9J6GG45_HAELO|nr:hypothetical protein HPB48_007447 [Haemaphysalis longicornis]